MAKKHPEFDYSLCISCGICAQACPVSCLSMAHIRKQGKYKKPCPQMEEPGCIGCGICAKACPMEAIAMLESENDA